MKPVRLWRAPTWSGRALVNFMNAVAPLSKVVFAWRLRPWFRYAAAFVLAAALLTPLDALQQAAGLVSAGTLPWLAPLRFGALGILFGLGAPLLDPEPRRASAVPDVLLFAAAYASTALSWRHPWATAAILGAMLLVGSARAQANDISRGELAPFVWLLALGGTALEAGGVGLGLFRYYGPLVLGVPAWLPLLWACGAFAVRGLFAGRSRS